MPKKSFLISHLLFICLLCSAQSSNTFCGRIFDAQNNEALSFATIRLKSDSGKFYGAISDAEGKFSIRRIEGGHYRLIVSYIGYETQESSLSVNGNVEKSFRLLPSSTTLNEVVVTASESKGITSASKIDRTAMEHLQPSSFTDLLALLPGGSTSTPDMSRANTIRLREAGTSGSNYNTGALGTQFVIDGTPVSTASDMQAVASDITTLFDRYNAVNAGVDMRSISTDNIESVEIVRGIPSVRYNNLTSGVVIINRKLEAAPLEARFKADQSSRLFAVGKGVKWENKGIALAADLNFLDSRSDPRNRYDSYKRISASTRLSKQWTRSNGYALEWQTNADYSGNIDNVKNDPDIEKLQEESYRSSFHSGRWGNRLSWTAPKRKAFRRLTLNLSAGMSWDKIKRSRFIQLNRDLITPIHTEEGEHDAVILPYKYTAYAEVDGKPVSIHAKAEAEFILLTGLTSHKLLAGSGFDYDKNFGNGQVYAPARPLNPLSGFSRPRKYSDIPASERWQVYVEDNALIPIGRHSLEVQAGISGNMMLNLDNRYALNGKVYFDPRLNVQWNFPGINIGKEQLKINLTGGMGMLTLMPTLTHLYPEKIYMDFTQLNFWHANAAYKRINLRTYIVDPANYAVTPARNIKWEVRMGLKYRKNTLSVTYFRERMNNGFRSIASYAPYEYKVYDASHVDKSTLTAPPALEDMPYTVNSALRGYSYTGNGSRTWKEGVEFQLSTERFKALNTRFTVNGAWLHTVYENSEPVFKSTSTVVNGVALSDKYIGLYEVEDSNSRERFNTNFTADTYLKKLGLSLSATAECMWYYSLHTPKRTGTPIAYMDVTGKVSPYTEADKSDIYKQHLIFSYTSSLNEKDVTPFYMYVNFKATKEFGKHTAIALFANRILDWVPDYTRNGYLIRRTAASPYFGMELKLKL